MDSKTLQSSWRKERLQRNLNLGQLVDSNVSFEPIKSWFFVHLGDQNVQKGPKNWETDQKLGSQILLLDRFSRNEKLFDSIKLLRNFCLYDFSLEEWGFH